LRARTSSLLPSTEWRRWASASTRDRDHGGLEQVLGREFGTLLADDLALHLLSLQLGKLGDSGRHIIEAGVDGREIDLGRLLHHGRERGDLGFEPLDLAGFANSAGEQLDDLGQLFDLGSDFAHVGRAVASTAKLAFETAEPITDARNEMGEFAELGHVGGAAIDGRNGGGALATADLGDGGVEIVAVIVGREAIDGALDAAQRFAAAIVCFGCIDLIAQVADAVREAADAPCPGSRCAKSAFYLIEKRHQFAAQGLPIPGAGVESGVCVVRLRKGAGHGQSLSKRTRAKPKQHEGLTVTFGKTW
jgi:hypothetical protein